MNNSFFKRILTNSIFLLVIFPAFSFAEHINFSEIMADPEGTDTNREWVEIKNSASSSISIEKYKFCDSGSCHGIYDGFGNDFNIPGNSFGVFSKNPEEFKKDYPNYPGFIFKSSFTLTNSGEKLELKNSDGNVISLVEYDGYICGKNGDSCSLFDDVWKNGKSTPGEENIFKSRESESSPSSGSDDEVKIERTYVEINDGDLVGGKKKIRAEIVDNISVLMAGAESVFYGKAYGITGVEISKLDFVWNFGDGKTARGKNVAHTFSHPGEYLVTLKVKSSGFSGYTRKKVLVINSQVEISEVHEGKNWVKLKNNYSDILKVDGWIIMVDGKKFQIPEESFILAGKEVVFTNNITNLDVKKDSKIFLLFPNGEKQSEYFEKKELEIEKVEEKTKPENKIKKHVEKVVSKIKNFSKTEVFKKTPEKIDGKESDFFERNFFQENKNELAEKFFSDDFKKEDLENNKKIFLKYEEKFLSKNKYFLFFIFFVLFLVLISFWLNFLKNKNEKKDGLKKEASDFEIEEV